VSDSGEGRWTIKAGNRRSRATPVLTASLYERFSSRGEADLPTNSYPRCGSNSVDTWRNRQKI